MFRNSKATVVINKPFKGSLWEPDAIVYSSSNINIHKQFVALPIPLHAVDFHTLALN